MNADKVDDYELKELSYKMPDIALPDLNITEDVKNEMDAIEIDSLSSLGEASEQEVSIQSSASCLNEVFKDNGLTAERLFNTSSDNNDVVQSVLRGEAVTDDQFSNEDVQITSISHAISPKTRSSKEIQITGERMTKFVQGFFSKKAWGKAVNTYILPAHSRQKCTLLSTSEVTPRGNYSFWQSFSREVTRNRNIDIDTIKTCAEGYIDKISTITELFPDRLTWDCQDTLATSLWPRDGPYDKKSCFPINTRAFGNCFPCAISRLVTGTQNHHKELRMRMTIEGALHREWYKDHHNLALSLPHLETGKSLPEQYANFSGTNMDCINDCYDRELVRCFKLGESCGLWQIHHMASVIGRPIISVFPEFDDLEDTAPLRFYHNRTISPRLEEDRNNTPVVVMWTKSAPNTDVTANHFVPVVRNSPIAEVIYKPATADCEPAECQHINHERKLMTSTTSARSSCTSATQAQIHNLIDMGKGKKNKQVLAKSSSHGTTAQASEKKAPKPKQVPASSRFRGKTEKLTGQLKTQKSIPIKKETPKPQKVPVSIGFRGKTEKLTGQLKTQKSIPIKKETPQPKRVPVSSGLCGKTEKLTGQLKTQKSITIEKEELNPGKVSDSSCSSSTISTRSKPKPLLKKHQSGVMPRALKTKNLPFTSSSNTISKSKGNERLKNIIQRLHSGQNVKTKLHKSTPSTNYGHTYEPGLFTATPGYRIQQNVNERERNLSMAKLNQKYLQESKKPDASTHEVSAPKVDANKSAESTPTETDKLKSELVTPVKPDASTPGVSAPKADANKSAESTPIEADELKSELVTPVKPDASTPGVSAPKADANQSAESTPNDTTPPQFALVAPPEGEKSMITDVSTPEFDANKSVELTNADEWREPAGYSTSRYDDDLSPEVSQIQIDTNMLDALATKIKAERSEAREGVLELSTLYQLDKNAQKSLDTLADLAADGETKRM